MEPTHCQETGHDPTVGVICPLGVELQAVFGVLDILERPTIDNVFYYIGMVGRHCTVAVALPSNSPGPRAAIAQASKLDKAFPGLKYRFLVGVAGGFPSKADVRLGDVVIATSICPNDFTKRNTTGFELYPKVQKAPDIITSLLPGLCADAMLDDDLKTMRLERPERASCWDVPEGLIDVLYKPTYHCQSPEEVDCLFCEQSQQVLRLGRATTSPKVHHGLISSGAYVLKDGQFRDELRDGIVSKIGELPLAIETEAVGLEGFIVVRGICDYADSHKHKRWQQYAAATAAACLKVLLRHLDKYEGPASSYSLRQDPAIIEHQDLVTSLAIPRHKDSSDPQAIDSECDPGQSALEDTATIASDLTTSQSIGRSQNVDQYPDVDIGRAITTAKLTAYDITIKNLPVVLRLPDLEGMTAVVHLTELSATPHFKTSRRLVIDLGDPHPVHIILWLPLDSVRTEINAAELKLTFSDCRVRQPSSSNGTKSYLCSYDTEKPNTTVVLNMIDSASALSFRDKVLHRDSFVSCEPCYSTDKFNLRLNSQSPSQSHQIQVWPVGESYSESSIKKGFILIATELDTDSTATIFYSGHHLDFDITWPEIGIRLRELQRTVYRTSRKRSAVWPPPWIDQSASGGAPQAIELEQSNMIEVQPSRADLVLFKEFLKALTGWDLTFCGSAKYAVKTVKRSNGVKRCRAGVSVWSRGEESRIHCRNHQENLWISTCLTKLPFPLPAVSGFPCPALSPGTNRSVVKISDTVIHKGPHILLATFDADGDVKSASQIQDFEFEKAEYAKSFTEALAQYVIEPQLSGQRSSLSSEPLPRSSWKIGRRRSNQTT